MMTLPADALLGVPDCLCDEYNRIATKWWSYFETERSTEELRNIIPIMSEQAKAGTPLEGVYLWVMGEAARLLNERNQ